MGELQAAVLSIVWVLTSLHVLATSVSVDGQKPNQWKEVEKEGKKVQELKIEAPAMTEEDQYGYNMPQRYKCDSCKAVMFHLADTLKKKHPKSKRLKSWEYTDLFDDVCKTGFSGYGIKLVNGENALGGPGLPKNNVNVNPGGGTIQMSSENWSKRLGEICRKMIYEQIGEEEMYEMFYNKLRAEDPPADWAVDLSEDFCHKETRDCTTGPKTPPQKPEAEETRPRPRPRPRPREDKKAKVAKADKKPKKETVSSPSTGTGEKVDVQTFLRQLATQHGLTSDEYLTSRTPKEWEKLILAVGGRIFNKQAEL